MELEFEFRDRTLISKDEFKKLEIRNIVTLDSFIKNGIGTKFI